MVAKRDLGTARDRYHQSVDCGGKHDHLSCRVARDTSQLYEAVDIDGGSWFSKLTNVTIPMMTPIIFYNLIMGIINSFQVFTDAYIMTNGGPHNATLFYVLYLYKNAFQYFEMGYASALAWVLFLLILAFTILVFKSSSLWVYYESEVKKG